MKGKGDSMNRKPFCGSCFAVRAACARFIAVLLLMRLSALAVLGVNTQAFTSTFPGPNPPSGVTLYENASILSGGGLQLNPASQGSAGAAVISNLDVGSQGFSLSAEVTTTNGGGNIPADGWGIYLSAPGVVPVGGYQDYEGLGVGSGIAMLVDEYAGTISIETSNTTFPLTLPSHSILVGNLTVDFAYDPTNGAVFTLTGSDGNQYQVSASAAQLAAAGLSLQSGYVFTLGGRAGYPGTTNADSHTINSLTIDTATSGESQAVAFRVNATNSAPQFAVPILVNDQLTLSWSSGGNSAAKTLSGTTTLLSATNLAGPWTAVTNATSPYTTPVDIHTPQLFFKLEQQ